MEDWELDFEWLKVRHFVKDSFGREQLPDLNAILFLIGVQELGWLKDSFTKEEKQDLMHVAVCQVLSFAGFYRFLGRDADGWPHYELVRKAPAGNLKAQERLLKENIIRYFRELEEK